MIDPTTPSSMTWRRVPRKEPQSHHAVNESRQSQVLLGSKSGHTRDNEWHFNSMGTQDNLRNPGEKERDEVDKERHGNAF